MSSYIPSWTGWRDTLFVYVMKGANLRKIGVTIDPYRRLAEVRREVGEPVILEFMASHPVRYLQRVEAAVHADLSDKREHGEWFSVSDHEAEMSVLRCLLREAEGASYGDLDADYEGVRNAVVAQAEQDLNAIQQKNLSSIILNGPPADMTATLRLCAFLDWRYGSCAASDVAQRHGISKATMVRCFGDRLGRIKKANLLTVNSNDLRRIFGLWLSDA